MTTTNPTANNGRWLAGDRWSGLLIIAASLSAGCESRPTPNPAGDPYQRPTMAYDPLDAEKLKSADVSLLFIGNSHTSVHDLPDLIADMIEFRHPEKTVYVHLRGVGFLDEIPRDRGYAEALNAGPWTAVVLQGQKISKSGRYDYSRDEGIAFAKQVKAAGPEPVFYAEWGMEGVEGDGKQIEGIYRAMVDASGASLAPVGRAWDLALAERPDSLLYSIDGNHQSDEGAFLTACVLYGVLTGDDPAELGSFPYRDYDEEYRQFLADKAAEALGR